MKYYKNGYVHVANIETQKYSPLYHIYFLRFNRVEKDEPYNPVQKSSLMKAIEKTILKQYAFTTYYREQYNITNLK